MRFELILHQLWVHGFFCFRPKSVVIADFGCGDGRLAQSLPQNKVYSFDLVATKPYITACDIAKVGVILLLSKYNDIEKVKLVDSKVCVCVCPLPVISQKPVKWYSYQI